MFTTLQNVVKGWDIFNSCGDFVTHVNTQDEMKTTLRKLNKDYYNEHLGVALA